MSSYKVKLTIEAQSPEQLEEKLQAFQDLNDHLTHQDLITAVDVVVEHPDVIDFIKEVVPEEGKELTLSDYVSIARKAFVRFGE